jgi:hypothetical protein
MDHLNHLLRLIKLAFISLLLIFGFVLWNPSFDLNISWNISANASKVKVSKSKKEIIEEYSLIDAPELVTVQKHCSGCHSNRLIAQNKNTREGWKETIQWMQATQGLWDLGKDEVQILDYLSANYAPQNSGRRANLTFAESDWYFLKDENVK